MLTTKYRKDDELNVDLLSTVIVLLKNVKDMEFLDEGGFFYPKVSETMDEIIEMIEAL